MKTIHIEVEWRVEGKPPTKKLVARYHCSGPIIALNMLHRELQRTKAQKDRKVVRPKLLPGDYKVIKMYEVYQDISGTMIHNHYDLPDTANPSCLPQKQVKQEPPPTLFDMEEYEHKEA